MNSSVYKCITCNENLFKERDGLKCNKGHSFRFLNETSIPVFEFDQSENEYTLKEVAERYDNSMNWVLETFCTTNEYLRTRLVSRLHLKLGDKVLVTGCGLGDDLPFICDKIGTEGIIYAQDYSKEMVSEAQIRMNNDKRLSQYNIVFSVSDAANLPFKDASFDAAYHFGGINLFPDIKKGICEMDRVAKEGAKIVFGDECVPAWLKNTEHAKMLIENNPLCEFDLPLEHLPITAREVNISWEANYYFYVIEFVSSKEKLKINYNVPHKGLRGGNMQTRYYGKLEGIDLELKNKIYKLASDKKVSRVDFMEKLLKEGLKNV
ncbi:class I SAM-dependent methyltransferase [Sulfurimonas sp.]|uniref:class I SAM-dependent methyltransferase n=1 Tax=Sulfurimonas sp. TaxID=2022749 RepID=UPI0019FFADAC|nr:class I SAM-dependent methyltransferase [Sulfurimonas sp.]MBE0515243.1 class I SAM-dependent methyltransferase [Sulfurimonas sp.]